MKIFLTIFLCFFLGCTQITYLNSRDELSVFRIQNKIVKVDTLKLGDTVYKVYYRNTPW